jgi:hypothetical protein
MFNFILSAKSLLYKDTWHDGEGKRETIEKEIEI